METPEVLLNPHFKVYIPFKFLIKMESSLTHNNINYFSNKNEAIGNEIRFYFLEKDKEIIDKIIKSNDIISSVESNIQSDWEDNRKILLWTLKVFIVVIAIALLIVIIT